MNDIQHYFKPDDRVKTCKFIERGVRFWTQGIVCCSAVTDNSPVIITAEEMKTGHCTPDIVAARRRRLFEALNGLNDDPLEGCATCHLVEEKIYSEVDFDHLGGLGCNPGASSFNIAHFSMCNARCKYCLYTIENDFVPPQYNNIIEFIENYRKIGKFSNDNNIDYNGGEPTILDNFEEILDYLVDNKIGVISIYSNCIKYSEALNIALQKNAVTLITSLDAGTSASYKEIHGVDAFDKSIETMIRYRKSGTQNLIVKYNICKDNMSKSDLYGFALAMVAIRPNQIYICPEFPYGDAEIHDGSAVFGAKLFCLIEDYMRITPHIQTDDMKGDEKLMQFSDDMRMEIAKIRKSRPPSDSLHLYTPKQRLRKIEYLFSITNDSEHKILRLFGVKIKFKRK